MPTLPTASSSEPRPVAPLALGVSAWAAAWLGTGIEAGWVSVGVAAGVVLILIGWRRRSRLVWALVLMVAVVLGASAARTAAVRTGPITDLAAQQAVVNVEVVVGEGQWHSGLGGPTWFVPLRVQRVDGRGTSWWSGATLRLSATGERGQQWSALAPGSTVEAVVKLAPCDDVDVSAWAAARSVPQLIRPPTPIDAAVNAIRAGLRDAMVGLPADPAALVPALVLGDTSAMPERLQADFQATGLTHLTAVSGANLTLLLAAVLWLAGRAGVLGWWRRGLAVVVVAGFVVLCRAEPSVLRAAAMGLVGLAGLGWAGPRQGLRYVSWSVVGLVLIDPWLARSVGFALSVLATGGIVLFSRRWTDVAAAWAPRWLAEAVAVPLAAQLVTQPVVSAISGQVSLVGLAANLLAGPLVGPGTVLGFAAAWAAVPLPWLARVLGWGAAGFAQTLCWIAAAGAALPGAWLTWPATVFAVVLLGLGCVLLVLVMPAFLARRWLVLAVTAALVVACLRPLTPPGWPPDGWLVVACDVGQGDATVIRAGPGAAIVVDAGPEPRAVDRCLDQLGIERVPWLVFTHPHADHIGGASGVGDGRRVDQVLLPAVNPNASGWTQVRTALAGVPVMLAQPGLVVAAGQAQLTVLAEQSFVAPAVLTAESAEENDSSLVLRAETGGMRVLLAGDLQETGQAATLAAVPDLSADVLLVPHHGSSHQSPAFLAAAHARIALISVGVDNDYGHPAARTVVAVQNTGAHIVRTDRTGAVAVARSGADLVITTQRSGP